MLIYSSESHLLMYADLCVGKGGSVLPMFTINVQWGDTEIGTLCNSRDSVHTAANFDTLLSVEYFVIYTRNFRHKIIVMLTICVPNFKAKRLIGKEIFKIY